MTPDEVARSYDLIADRWASDTFPRLNGIEQHKRAIAFVTQRRRALDIGCGGSGRIIDLLIEHGFEVEGIDVSRRMIELARQRHPAVTFHHADICTWQISTGYDLISAWDSIWHVSMAEQRNVLKKVLGGLNAGGVCVFTTGGVDSPAENVNAEMGPPMYHGALGIPATLNLIEEAGRICRHLEYDQLPESHVYVIAQRV